MLTVTDMIVVSIMDKQTGNYVNCMVTNRPRWKLDCKNLHEGAIIMLEVFPIGKLETKVTYHSIEEFEENEINI